MNWFLSGLNLSDEQFAALKLDFQSNRKTIENHLDDLLLCWAKAFFQIGDGHRNFWTALEKGVFANRLPYGWQAQAFEAHVKDAIRRRFNLATNGGLRGWFFENCWLVSGVSAVAGARPNGRTSEMVRDILDLDDELTTARLRGQDCQNVALELTEQLGKLANTLNVPELRAGVLDALAESNSPSSGLVREAVQRFREDAEHYNSVTAASCGWFLDGSRVSGYRLVLRFSFKSRFVDAANGCLISIGALESRVSATGEAVFDGWDILSRYRDCPGQISWSIDSNLNLPRKKEVVAGLKSLLQAETGNRAVFFVESALTSNHRIADSDAQKEDDPIPQVVPRAILAITRNTLVQDATACEILPISLCQAEGMVVARHSALNLANQEPQQFTRYNTTLWYRGRYDAAIYEGEDEDFVLHLRSEGGEERLHAFTGERLARSGQGQQRIFEVPSEQRQVQFFDCKVVYVPTTLAEAIAGGRSAKESNWEYVATQQDEKSVRLQGGRVGVLYVDGREISVLKVIRFIKPLMWFEDAMAQEYPTREAREFSSCSDLQGWKLQWIPSNDGLAASRQVLCFEYGDGNKRSISLSDGVSVHGIHEMDLAQDWQRYRGALPTHGAENDSLYLNDAADSLRLLKVKVEPNEITVWPSEDSDGINVYSPTTNESQVLLVMSSKALDEEGSLKDQEERHTFKLLEPGFGLERGGTNHIGAEFCEGNEFPEGNAVYAIVLDAGQALDVQEDFSVFGNVPNRRWCLVRRGNQAVERQFANYELVSERLGFVLPPDAAQNQPESFEWAKRYCDSIEHNPLLLGACWKKHLARGDSIKDTLRSLLDGANPINIFACPEPCQYQRIGWRCETWLHSVLRLTCPAALEVRSGRVLFHRRNVNTGEVAHANALQRESWLSAAISTQILAQLVNDMDCGHPCIVTQTRTPQQHMMVQRYIGSGSLELSALVSHGPTLNRSIFPYNNEEVDVEARRSFIIGDDILKKFGVDGACVDNSRIMTCVDAEKYAALVADWVDRLYQSSWPKPQTSFARVLKSVLDQLKSDVRDNLLPTDLAVLAISAIVSRVAAVMGVGDTSRIFFTDQQADEVDEIAQCAGLRAWRFWAFKILGNATKTDEDMRAELQGMGFRSGDAEKLVVVADHARNNNVPWPSDECMSMTREVVRKAFMLRYEGVTDAYWALLQYYVVFADVMISGR